MLNKFKDYSYIFMQKQAKTAIPQNLQTLFFKPNRNSRSVCGPAAHFRTNPYALKKESNGRKSEKKDDAKRNNRTSYRQSKKNAIIF